jgi:hypothetical protein
MRERIRGTIEAIVEEELEEALGAARWKRVGAKRTGYRHGKRPRTLSTSLGATTIMMPRARIDDDDGRTGEWHSAVIPRYQRRTESVECQGPGAITTPHLQPDIRMQPVSRHHAQDPFAQGLGPYTGNPR